jgi:plasmid maintenance system antidote protein VapI
MTEAMRESPPLRELVLTTLKRMGHNQHWLAERVEVSPKTLSQILWCDRPLGAGHAVDMEEALGIGAEFLMAAYVNWALAFERGRREEPSVVVSK